MNFRRLRPGDRVAAIGGAALRLRSKSVYDLTYDASHINDVADFTRGVVVRVTRYDVFVLGCGGGSGWILSTMLEKAR